jgi:hypothetical protein
MTCQHLEKIKRSGCTNDRPPVELYWILECNRCGHIFRQETRDFVPRTHTTMEEFLEKISDADDPEWYRLAQV